MKNKAFILAISMSCLLFQGCNSDETLNRDEVTMKAVYQEYDVNYNMKDRKIRTEVAFRTSILGSYVKLDGNDKISFKVEDSEVSTYRELGMKREQVYWGSKNVPVYKGSAKLNSLNNNRVIFNWYDSETDENISVSTKLNKPGTLNFSHDIENELNTIDGDQLTVVLKDGIEANETLFVTISNPLHYSSGGISYSFSGSRDKELKEFKISAAELRADSFAKNTKTLGTKKKKYGNLELKVKTEKVIPVLTSGRQEYRVDVQLRKAQSVESRINKGGMIRSTIVFPEHKIDIVF